MINPKISVAADSLGSIYNNADNYPHIVLDNFIDQTVIEDVALESSNLVSNLDDNAWRFGTPDEHESQVLKRGIKNMVDMPPYMVQLCRYLNNDTFLEFLREMTGIEDLVADWGLEGGGFHVTYPGGLLNIHHDFNYTDGIADERMYRKVNLLIYLNEEWEEDWNGSLELWKSDLSQSFKTIVPKFNRAVLFNIEDAPHGHPNPLACPENDCRRSLAFYYYSKTPPKNKLYERAYWKNGTELL